MTHEAPSARRGRGLSQTPRRLSAYPASFQQRRALRDLVACRTAVLGGHLRRCQACGHEEIAYNSCRNRHCPKCQGHRQAAWLAAQQAKLLDVPYFHVVFTLPDRLGPLALQNQRLLYGLLFRAASETLQVIARDERHLGAQIGFTAVLHTWGQTLQHHPHLHCVVPAGGLSLDEQRWVAAREFLPVRVLSRLFRAKYLAYLRQAYGEGRFVLTGRLQDLAQPKAWRAFLEPVAKIEWVVYAKPPFGSPEHEVSGQLHAPSSDLEPAVDRPGRGTGRLPLQRLPARPTRPRDASIGG